MSLGEAWMLGFSMMFSGIWIGVSAILWWCDR